MAVHMIRVLCELPKGDADVAVQNWVDNYAEWTDDPVTHGLTETTASLDGSDTVYLRGDWRFIDQGEDQTAMLNDLHERLDSMQGGLWHRLGYHVCTHDEGGGPCAWDETVAAGQIPSDIPTIT